MRDATFELFASMHDALKARHPCTLCNIFQDSLALRKLLAEKPCLLHKAERAFFLLIPYHEYYHDCLYLAADIAALEEGLEGLLTAYCSPLAIRGSVIGKERLAEEVALAFQRQGFRLEKKLLRMLLGKAPEKIRKALLVFVEEYRNSVSFARPDDAEEVLEILLESFDLVADNIPELSAIRENIAKQQVAILRRDDKILSLNYFDYSNGQIRSLFDVTRKEYRKEGLFLAIQVFLKNYFTALNMNVLRFVGWRDVTAIKLLKHSEESNQHVDGVVIYNMLWMPGSRLLYGRGHP